MPAEQRDEFLGGQDGSQSPREMRRASHIDSLMSTGYQRPTRVRRTALTWETGARAG